MSKQKLNNLPVSKLNALYLGKTAMYKSLQGRIINIAYYSNMKDIPYAEIELYLWDCRTTTKILPLQDLVLISSKIA